VVRVCAAEASNLVLAFYGGARRKIAPFPHGPPHLVPHSAIAPAPLVPIITVNPGFLSNTVSALTFGLCDLHPDRPQHGRPAKCSSPHEMATCAPQLGDGWWCSIVTLRPGTGFGPGSTVQTGSSPRSCSLSRILSKMPSMARGWYIIPGPRLSKTLAPNGSLEPNSHPNCLLSLKEEAGVEWTDWDRSEAEDEVDTTCDFHTSVG
jgi:hypothetical protein